MLIQYAVFVFRPSPRDRALDGALAKDLKLFAIKADLDARSVEAPSSVEVIGCGELVELITRYGRTLSEARHERQAIGLGCCTHRTGPASCLE